MQQSNCHILQKYKKRKRNTFYRHFSFKRKNPPCFTYRSILPVNSLLRESKSLFCSFSPPFLFWQCFCQLWERLLHWIVLLLSLCKPMTKWNLKSVFYVLKELLPFSFLLWNVLFCDKDLIIMRSFWLDIEKKSPVSIYLYKNKPQISPENNNSRIWLWCI